MIAINSTHCGCQIELIVYIFSMFIVLKAIELNNLLKGKSYDEYADKMREQFKELGWQFLCSVSAYEFRVD